MSEGEPMRDRSAARGDALLGELLSRTAATRAAGALEPCPDALLLAGYAEQRLVGDEALELETHLARCGACREVLAALAEQAEPEPREPRATKRSARRAALRWVPVLAAAALLFVLVQPRRVERSIEELAAGDAEALSGATRSPQRGDDFVVHLRVGRSVAIALFALDERGAATLLAETRELAPGRFGYGPYSRGIAGDGAREWTRVVAAAGARLPARDELERLARSGEAELRRACAELELELCDGPIGAPGR